jgi:hypothetical protein
VCATELAHDDVHHVEHLDLEICELRVQRDKRVPDGPLRKEGESRVHDLEIEPVARGELRARPLPTATAL